MTASGQRNKYYGYVLSSKVQTCVQDVCLLRLHWSEVKPAARTPIYDFTSWDKESRMRSTAVTPRSGDLMESDIRTSSLLRVLALSANLRNISPMFVLPLLTRIDPNRIPSTSVSSFLWEAPLERNSRYTEKRPRYHHMLSHHTRLTLTDEIIFVKQLTLILLMCRIWWAPNNARKRQIGFNSAFKGLTH